MARKGPEEDEGAPVVAHVVDVLTDELSIVEGAPSAVNRELRRRFPAAANRAADFGLPALLSELRTFAFVLILDAEAYRAAARDPQARRRAVG
jgi:hypothetical protein